MPPHSPPPVPIDEILSIAAIGNPVSGEPGSAHAGGDEPVLAAAAFAGTGDNELTSHQQVRRRGLPAFLPVSQGNTGTDILTRRGRARDVIESTLLAGSLEQSNARAQALGAAASPLTACCCDRKCVAPIDYSTLEFVDHVDEYLNCPICHSPFIDPTTTACGHTFCNQCLRRAMQTKEECPIDRRHIDLDSTVRPHTIKDQIERLRVRCPNKSCHDVATIADLPSHYAKCDWTLVHCPKQTCNQRTLRIDAGRGASCLHETRRCEYCGRTVVRAELEAHYDDDCSGNMQVCAKCSVLVVRHRMRQHVATGCEKTVLTCKSAVHGCRFKDERPRVEQHERGCVYEAIGKLRRQRFDDRLIIDELRARLEHVESQLERTDSASTASIVRLGRSMPSTEDYMLAQFERIEARMDELRRMVGEQANRSDLLLHRETRPMQEQLSDVTSRMDVLSIHTGWLMNQQRQSRYQQHFMATAAPPTAAGRTNGGGDSGSGPGPDAGAELGPGLGRGAGAGGGSGGVAASSHRSGDFRGDQAPRL